MKPVSKPLPVGTRQVLLSFSTPHSSTIQPGEERALTVPITRHFLPLGLFVWGASVDTYFRGLYVGSYAELELSGTGRVPGRYFHAQYTFEGLEQLAARGELELAVEDRQVLEMNEATPGQRLQLIMEGPFDQLCVWGLTYDQQAPFLQARVTPVEPYASTAIGPPRYRGTLIESRLRGERPLVDIEAPSEQTVALLLAASLESQAHRRWP